MAPSRGSATSILTSPLMHPALWLAVTGFLTLSFFRAQNPFGTASALLPIRRRRRERRLDAESERLIDFYARSAQEFCLQGLDAPSVQAAHQFFHGLDGGGLEGGSGGVVAAKTMAEMGLQPGATRNIIITFDEAPDMCAAAEAFARSVQELLPKAAKPFVSLRETYHCTLFRASRPEDPRPNTAVPYGGVDLELPPCMRRSPTSTEMQRELETMQRVVRQMPRMQLVLDRVFMARSGTLILAFYDEAGVCQELPEETRSAIDGACGAWTAQMRGRRFSPSQLYVVHEVQFSSIKGPSWPAAFKA